MRNRTDGSRTFTLALLGALLVWGAWPSSGANAAPMDQMDQSEPPAEWDQSLTRTVYLGSGELTIKMTRVTPDYLRAVHAADLRTGRTDVDFSAYKETYRIGRAIPFMVEIEGRTDDLSSLDLQKAAVLIDDGGREYAATGWEEMPDATRGDGFYRRTGIVFFPMFCEDGSHEELSAWPESVEVALRGIGPVRESRSRWVFPNPDTRR